MTYSPGPGELYDKEGANLMAQYQYTAVYQTDLRCVGSMQIASELLMFDRVTMII